MRTAHVSIRESSQVEQARLEQNLGNESVHVHAYLDSEEYAEALPEHEERFVLAIRRQAEAQQQLAAGISQHEERSRKRMLNLAR